MVKIVREELIQKLATGKFVSGQILAEELNVSRAAISKHIKALNEIGLDIFSVKGKGYKLSKSIKLLDAHVITEHLRDNEIESRIDVYSTIDSTNSFLLRRLPNDVTNGQACVAEYQSAGRGRRGKKWQSPFGSHLYLSLYWQLEQGISAAMGLSIVVGIAVANLLTEEFAMDVQLKWPNDIYFEGRKLAGILVELDGQSNSTAHCVIGLGLNIEMPQLSSNEIDQPWADLSQAINREVDRNRLTAKLIKSIMEKLALHNQFGIAPMLNEWQKRDYFINKPVKLLTGDKETRGICKGINNQGALLLDIDGKEKPFYGGEVSLRGL